MSIKELRLAAGMTQEQLARKMKIDQSTVSLWEKSEGATKPLQKNHKRLAKILGCTVEELRAAIEKN